MAGWLHGCCPGHVHSSMAQGVKTLDSIWALWDDFLAFLGRLVARGRDLGAQVSSQQERRGLSFPTGLGPGPSSGQG